MRRLPVDYAVRNLGRSPVRLALSLVGSTLVVLLAIAAAAFVRGMGRSLVVSGGERNLILLGAGSEESVERSEIQPAVPGLVTAGVNGIRQRLGVAYVSPEVHMFTTVKMEREQTSNPQAMVRGILEPSFLVHSQVSVIEGRAALPGRDEILVGKLAAQKLGVPTERLSVGKTVFFDERTWTITGVFAAPGSVMESEIWCPLTDLQIAARRDNLSCVILTLDDGADFDDVDAFTKQRLDLELVAMRETDYYGKLAAFFGPIRAMVWATAILIASGGILGGLNTMYAAFASRVREVGSLQVLGFSRRAIVTSLVQESVLAAAAGTVLASLISLILLDGITVQFSAGVFGLVVDANVVGLGLIAGLLLGLVGALPPAFRCLRLPIPEALKAS
jgi:putative ABC transport system permease protein